MANQIQSIDLSSKNTQPTETSLSTPHKALASTGINAKLLTRSNTSSLNTEQNTQLMDSQRKTTQVSQQIFQSPFEIPPDDQIPSDDKGFTDLRADLSGLFSSSKPCKNSFTSSIDSVERKAALKESLEDYNFQPITRVFSKPKLIADYGKSLLKQGNKQSCSVSCACMIVQDKTGHLHEGLHKLIDEFEPCFDEDLREMKAILTKESIDYEEGNIDSLPLDLSMPSIIRGRFSVAKKEEMDHWIIIDQMPGNKKGNCTIRDPYSGKAACVPFSEINSAIANGYARISPNVLKVLELPV